MTERPARPSEGHPREAHTSAVPSYSDTKKSFKPVLVIIGGLALVAAIVVGVSLIPGGSSGGDPGSQPTVVPPAVEPTTSAYPDSEPTTDAVPTTPAEVPGYATVLSYGLEDGETVTDVIEGYAVTMSASQDDLASAYAYGLSVQVIDTASGEYVSDLDITTVVADPTVTQIIEGDPGAWRVTAYRGDSGNQPALVAIITIDGDTRVAVGLGFGSVTSWGAS